jgi:Uma2 family endonuclease
MGYAGLRMTADEYLALGETQERYELIDGIVFMSPSPSMLHQRIKAAILFQLMQSAPECVAVADTDVRFGPALVYCPDVVAYAPGKLDPVPSRLTLPPDLAVEILSPSNRPLDLVTKRADYERFGVGEYWIVEPDSLSVRRFIRRGARFEEAPAGPGPLRPATIPGAAVDLAMLRS